MSNDIDLERLGAFAEATNAASRELMRAQYDPDPERTDWTARAADAVRLHDTVQPFFRDAARLMQLVEPGRERDTATDTVYGTFERSRTPCRAWS